MGVIQVDITGRQYGKLTAIKWAENVKRTLHSGRIVYYNYWEFVCECGKVKTLRKSSVVPLCDKSIKSCGCTRAKNNWRGYGLISGTYWGQIRKSAKIRGIKFNISKKYIWNLFLEQNGKCALTGVVLCLPKPFVKSDEIQTASLDRINSLKGYVIGNVQWVHQDINYMKQELEENKFIDWCQKVTKHNETITRIVPGN